MQLQLADTAAATSLFALSHASQMATHDDRPGGESDSEVLGTAAQTPVVVMAANLDLADDALMAAKSGYLGVTVGHMGNIPTWPGDQTLGQPGAQEQ